MGTKPEEFLRSQTEAVKVAREQYMEDFAGAMQERTQAVGFVLQLAELNNWTLTTEQLIKEANKLANFLSGQDGQ